MDLESARYHGQHSVSCFVCTYAGYKLELWPIEPGEYVWLPGRITPSGREWRIRIKNLGEDKWPARWTGKRASGICSVHAAELYAEWIDIARLEVTEAKAIYAYEQRKYEREELHGRRGGGYLPSHELDDS